MTDHKIGTREEWLAARAMLLERENEHAQHSEELAQQRLELPWVPVEKEYSFATEHPRCRFQLRSRSQRGKDGVLPLAVLPLMGATS